MSGEVHLLKGSDPVLLDDAVRALVDRLVGDASRDEVLSEFTGDDYDPGAVVLAAQTISMFGDRVVVARNLGRFGRGAGGSDADDDGEADGDGAVATPAAPEGADLSVILDYLADPAPDVSLVLVWSPPVTAGARRGPVPKKLSDAVKRAGGTVSDHGTPKGKGVSMWIGSRIDDSVVSLTAAARSLIEERLGEDINRLGGVLAVLEASYGTASRPLGPDDVEPFLGESGGVPPWDLTDAIDKGQVAVAVGNVRRMLGGGGRHPLQVMASLQSHYGRMLRLDGSGVRNEKDAAALLGMKGSTFPAKKALAQTAKLGSEGIFRAIGLLAAADADLRGRTGVAPAQVIEVLVARLAALSQRRGSVSSRRR